ncbi:MAG TPA: hypothetical protein DDZ51_16355 [Planctomycetaceae bacterium]|nr:hypothetical protein [Planctomycetaceae bacterium]
MPLQWNESVDDSGTVANNTQSHWHIIESSDRWYQAYQRSVATSSTSRRANVIRWDGQSVFGLPARLKQPISPESSIYVVWEYPLGDITPSRMLDLIATVSQHKPRPIQMAHFRPGVAGATLLAFQEAGISIVLYDLWTLRNVMRQIDR